MQLRQKRCWQRVTTGSSQVSMQMGHSFSRPMARVCSRSSRFSSFSPAPDCWACQSMLDHPCGGLESDFEL